MKKRGIRWKRTNAVALVALRVQQINTDWETAVYKLAALALGTDGLAKTRTAFASTVQGSIKLLPWGWKPRKLLTSPRQ